MCALSDEKKFFMPLNKSKGNMYRFVTHTWNTIKGVCMHGCSYCYMKRWGRQPQLRFDEKELKTDLGSGNFIFIGSSCDMWASNIPEEWIIKTLKHCELFDNNTYLWQTKNPENIRRILPYKSHVCVTIETNRHFKQIMQLCPSPEERVMQAMKIRHPLMITIEPIMDFDHHILIKWIADMAPYQVNIGADSQRCGLPEPGPEKLYKLIEEIKLISNVDIKANLKRLLI